MQQQIDNVIVFITATNAEEAQTITRMLLNRRRAACVNIVPEVHSQFWWKDKLDSAEESLLIVKTKALLLPDIVKSVKKLHSNSVPEIIAMPIIGGNPDYLDWLDNEVQ